MKWRAAAAILTLAVVAGLAVGIVAAGWSQTAHSGGGVNARFGSNSPWLYICEPPIDPANPGCGADDPFDNELIFEGPEDLLPGEHVWARIRLQNRGNEPLDIVSAEVTVEGANPECVAALWDEYQRAENVSLWILGKWVGLDTVPGTPRLAWTYDFARAEGNDNHRMTESHELQSFRPTLMDTVYREWPEWPADSPIALDYNSRWAVHIAPGDYEDMAIKVRLPYDLPVSCEGHEWVIYIYWEAVSVDEPGTITLRADAGNHHFWGPYVPSDCYSLFEGESCTFQVSPLASRSQAYHIEDEFLCLPSEEWEVECEGSYPFRGWYGAVQRDESGLVCDVHFYIPVGPLETVSCTVGLVPQWQDAR